MIIRNDDVAYDTKLSELKRFCEICDKYGFKIIQSITPIGEVKKVKSAKYSNDRIRLISNKKFSDNKEVVDYLQSRSDLIGVHGLYHTHSPTMEEIKTAKELLTNLNLTPTYFVPPFNEGSYQLEVEGLTTSQLSAEKGERLEDFLESGTPRSPIMYLHSWRFDDKNYTFEMLEKCFQRLTNSSPTIKIVGFHSGHDTSYCVLENGIPVIHEELERITRRKMDEGDGLRFFFERNKDTDIKYFTFGSWGARDGTNKDICFDSKADDTMRKMAMLNEGAYFEFGHHTCHAANAFYTSNFAKALIITVDGGGREAGNIRTALTISDGIDNKINMIKVFDLREVNIGGLYFKATKYIFGLSVRAPKGDQAGTVMAMATMGKPKYKALFADFNKNWQELRKIAKSSEQESFNVASSLQAHVEETFYKFIKPYIENSDYKKLVLSGGVSLNCVLTTKIRKWFPEIQRTFIDPVPYDAGLALGSARYLWHHVLGNPRLNTPQNMSPYLGKEYNKDEAYEALGTNKNKVKFEIVDDQEVLQKINEQKIISVFGGKSESGRRALGNRSILADPRNPEMKKIINEKVKHRQWFRPIAPAIVEEKVADWFVDPILSPYMSFALTFKEDQKNKVPAVVHYDNTGRLQTVNKALSPWFHGLLSKWEKLSGVPILVNTSFNDSEPIVETPMDAINCFLKTNIDYLYFFDFGYLVEKR